MELFARPRPKKPLLPHPSKKRKMNHTIEQISFDFDARADYLTGFHKRKVQRAKHAQEEAEKKAREEKIAMRKSLREERKKELEEHVEAVNNILKEAAKSSADFGESSEGEQGGWNGFGDDVPAELLDHEAEYIDEDRYTTVTVEAVDVTKDGLQKIRNSDDEDEDKEAEEKDSNSQIPTTESNSKKVWPKKTKKKKFRYESKVERKMTRAKQKAGKNARANARRGTD